MCAGSSSHTQEEALFPLSNDNRACVAMATGCAFYGLCACVCVYVYAHVLSPCVYVCAMFIVCPCSLFAWGVVQYQICYCSLSTLCLFLHISHAENVQVLFFIPSFSLSLFLCFFLSFLPILSILFFLFSFTAVRCVCA